MLSIAAFKHVQAPLDGRPNTETPSRLEIFFLLTVERRLIVVVVIQIPIRPSWSLSATILQEQGIRKHFM